MKSLSFGLKGKLMVLIVCSLIAFAGTITYSLMGVNTLAHQIEKSGTKTIPFALKIGDIRARIHAVMRFTWRSVLVDLNSEERRTAIKKLSDYRHDLFKDIDEIQQYTELYAESKDLIIELQELKSQLSPQMDHVISALEAKTHEKNQEIRDVISTELVPITIKITETSIKLYDFAEKTSKAETQDAIALSTSTKSNLIIVAAIACLAFLSISFVFASKVSSQLHRITEAVSGASSQVSSASEQLSNASEQLSSSSQEQASALEQTSASLTEISSMSDANSKGAEIADASVKEVYQISDETRQSMDELTSAMKLILESNARIEKLVKVIEEIGSKTEVIDDIVFKTQLLSFNASVEAERAGEHGRGFAVVAQEVGNLAQVSGKAALEISAIVKTSIKEAESVANENKSRVESGGVLAQETKDKMSKVLTNLSHIIESINKIVSACREQKQGINQISTSIQSLSQATQETAGTAEESASASVELSGQAQSLISLVNDLKEMVTGQRGGEDLLTQKKIESVVSAPSAKVIPFKAKASSASLNYHAPTKLKATGSEGPSDDGTSW